MHQSSFEENSDPCVLLTTTLAGSTPGAEAEVASPSACLLAARRLARGSAGSALPAGFGALSGDTGDEPTERVRDADRPVLDDLEGVSSTCRQGAGWSGELGAIAD